MKMLYVGSKSNMFERKVTLNIIDIRLVTCHCAYIHKEPLNGFLSSFTHLFHPIFYTNAQYRLHLGCKYNAFAL